MSRPNYRRRIYTTIQEKKYNTKLVLVVSQLRPPDDLPKSKVSVLIFHASTASDRLLGPYFFPPRLTGAVYLDFIRNFLPEMLQDANQQTEIHLKIVHDCDLSHLFLNPFQPNDAIWYHTFHLSY